MHGHPVTAPVDGLPDWTDLLAAFTDLPPGTPARVAVIEGRYAGRHWTVELALDQLLGSRRPSRLAAAAVASLTDTIAKAAENDEVPAALAREASYSWWLAEAP